MTKSIIYARFSDRPGADTSESCLYQREACESWCKEKKYEVVGYFEDKAVSGKTPIEDRPGLGEALGAMSRDYTLVVYNYDRLARDRMVHVAIESFVIGLGAHLASVMEQSSTENESPENELIRGIMQSLSSYQRQINAKRTSTAMKSHQKRGRVMSKKLPYGYKSDPEDTTRMVKDKAEQKSIRAMKSLKGKGASLGDIAKVLTKLGHKPRGEKWYGKSISRILDREAGVTK